MRSKTKSVSAILLACIMMISICAFALPVHAANKVQIKSGTYSGTLIDGDTDCELTIQNSGKKCYASLSIVKLCSMDDLVVKQKKKNKITITGLDPSENPIKFTGTIKKNVLTLVIKKTTWNYLSKGDTFTFRLK
ncbi:MAG: hypothetical protein IKF90_18360 [Parasporobacterium sp.]|nr:hypothetical protein [Parasporobacterium sp.]